MSSLKIGQTLDRGLGHSVASQLVTLLADLTISGQKLSPTSL